MLGEPAARGVSDKLGKPGDDNAREFGSLSTSLIGRISEGDFLMQQKSTTGHLSRLGKAVLRANDRLDRRYRGEYVAYIDTWKATKTGKKLSRKILAHGTLGAINKVWAELPNRIKPRVMLHYVDDLPSDTVRSESFQVHLE